jgi:hypothetical protein
MPEKQPRHVQKTAQDEQEADFAVEGFVSVTGQSLVDNEDSEKNVYYAPY